jgi:thioredoxin-disulfide reductase
MISITDKMKEDYDFIVIGAGCSGLAASMYAARLGMKTLCLGTSNGSEDAIGGVITTTDSVENYPGFTNISGLELARAIKEHAESYKLVTLRDERVVSVSGKDLDFMVKTEKEEYKAKAILFATGTRWKKLDIPGSREFEGKGVAYCALCDGPLYKNKTVAVIGGSDSAVKDVLVLAQHANKVFIIYRGERVRAEPVNLARLGKSKKIEIITQTNVTAVRGNENVEYIELDKAYNGKTNLAVDGVFVAIGHEIMSELAQKIGVKVNEKKEIIINHMTCETNVPGVYAAGDVANKPFKQAITGVAEGCTAAHSAYEHIWK